MYVFKNSRTLIFYSKIIENFFQSFFQIFDKNQNVENLTIATNWLKIHNRFLKNYIIFVIDIFIVKFFIFEIFDSNEKKSYHKFDFIVNVDQYDSKTHDENFRFNRFFEKQNMINDDRWYFKNDKNLKIRIFSWFYFYEIEHFRKKKNFILKRFSKTHNTNWIETFRIFMTIIIKQHECTWKSNYFAFFKIQTNW